MRVIFRFTYLLWRQGEEGALLRKNLSCGGVSLLSRILKLAILGSLLYPVFVHANPPHNVTAAEVELLPPYCKNTQGVIGREVTWHPSLAAQKWVDIMGNGFWRMHHYCYGLIAIMRADMYTTSQQERRALLKRAVNEFDFTIQGLPPDFIMLPEIYLKRGQVLLRLGDKQGAVSSWRRSIDLKPDYWPAYFFLGDYYEGKGDIAKAREILEQGLRHSPGSKALARKLAEVNKARTGEKAVE